MWLCVAYANIYKFLDIQHMWHNFCICYFENDIIYRKICDMWVLAKYVIAYVIAYSHITSVPF